MKFDKGTMATLLTAGLPLAAGGIGAYVASRNHQKNQQRQDENLRAVGRDLLTSAAFGKSLPVAQERFIELAAVAPKTMQQRSIAAPLLLAATRKEDFSSIVQRATTIERNMAASGVSPNTHQAFALGVQLGDKLTPMVMDIASLSPSQSGVHPGDVRYIAMQSLMSDSSRPLQKRMPAYFETNEGTHELFRHAEHLAKDPNALLQATQEHMHVSQSYQHMQNIENAVRGAAKTPKRDAAHTKKEAAALTKQASPEAMGTILATQYIMAKTAAEMHKEAYDFSPAFKKILMGAGSAALMGVTGVAIDKGFDAWSEHKTKGQLDSSFDTAFKRIQKGNVDDRFAEEVRVKIDSNPVHYRQMAREAFDVLAETSPTMAKHPIVARSFINSVILNEGAMPSQDLTTFSKIQDSRFVPKPFTEKFLPTFRAFGGEAAISAAAQEAVREPWRETEREWRIQDTQAAEHDRNIHARGLAAMKIKADKALAAQRESAQDTRSKQEREHAIRLERLRGHMRASGAPASGNISARQAFNRYQKDIAGNP